MRKGFKYLSVFLCISFLISIILLQFTEAQNISPKYGLILTPLIQDYKAKPGDTVKGTFKITHDFQDINREVNLYPYARDFTSDGTTGNPMWIYYNNNEEVKIDSSLESWVTIDKPTYKLIKQGESIDVNFTINIPANATGGTKQAGIIFTENSEGAILSDSSQVGISSDIAGLIFVEVEGERSIDLEVTDIVLTDIDGNTPLFNIFEYLPVNINLTVQNKGNSIAEPGGDIFITNTGKTGTIPALAFNSLGGRVLPKSSRIISETWADAFWVIAKNDLGDDTSFIEKIVSRYNLGFNFGKNFKIGVYDVVVKVLYFDTNGDAVLKVKNVTMTIFPWKIALIIVVIIVLLNLKRIIKSRRKNIVTSP